MIFSAYSAPALILKGKAMSDLLQCGWNESVRLCHWINCHGTGPCSGIPASQYTRSRADEITRLQSALSEARKESWQQIETAPRSSRVLLYLRRDDEPEFNMFVEGALLMRGWLWPGMQEGNSTRPTHWMPLPAPPGSKG